MRFALLLTINFSIYLNRVSGDSNEIQHLKNQMESMMDRIEQLESDNKVLKAKTRMCSNPLEGRITSKNSLIDDKTLDKRRLLLPLNNHLTNSTTLVAFSATLTQILTLGTHQAIEYDKVITNIGNAYDPRHGHFTAPFNGIYLIAVTGCNYYAISTYLDLVLNGEVLINLLLDGRSNQNSALSQTLVLMLNKGDMVWVRGNRENGKVFGSRAEMYNSFSGYCLFPMP